MKLYRTPTAIALGIATASSPALAQDARDTHFDGPYVSVFAGWSAQNNDRGDSIVFDNDRDGLNDDIVATAGGANAFSPGFCNGEALSAVPSGGCARDKDGIDYGARVGWDKRMGGNFVVGGLLEFSKNESKDGTSGFSTTPANYGIVRRLDYAVSARARAGYTPGGGALFYVTGGGSYAKINHRFFTTNGVNSFDEQRDGKMIWGWQAGGGGEIMLTDQVSFGLEYLYNRFRDNKYSVEVGQGTAPATNPFLIPTGGTNLRFSDRNFDYHSLRATVSYQF
jgi:outer membrane immunogenic protein